MGRLQDRGLDLVQIPTDTSWSAYLLLATWNNVAVLVNYLLLSLPNRIGDGRAVYTKSDCDIAHPKNAPEYKLL